MKKATGLILLILAAILFIAHMIKFWYSDYKTASDYGSVAAATLTLCAIFKSYIYSMQEDKNKDVGVEKEDGKKED